MSATGTTGSRPTAAAAARRTLLTLDTLPSETRHLAVGLHWAMLSLKSQWAALHVANPHSNKPTLLVATPAPADSSGSPGGALFDFLTGELQDSVGSLVQRAITLGHAITVGAGRGASHQVRLPCAALCVPLLDLDRRKSVGALTLLCHDAARTWSADEQSLLATAAPLFGLHLMRERLAAQAALLDGASGSGGQQQSKQVADHAAKVVHDMRSVHADALQTQRQAHKAELQQISADHLKERQQLEEALVAARQQVEETERASAVRMHRLVAGLEAQHIAELEELREEFGARDPNAAATQPRERRARPGSVPGTPGGPEAPSSPSASRGRASATEQAKLQSDIENLRTMLEQYRVEAKAEGSLTRDLIAELTAAVRGGTDHGSQGHARDRARPDEGALLAASQPRSGWQPSGGEPAMGEDYAARRIQARHRGLSSRRRMAAKRGTLAPLPPLPAAPPPLPPQMAAPCASPFDTPFACGGAPQVDPRSVASSKPVAVASKCVSPGSAPPTKPMAFARAPRPQSAQLPAPGGAIGSAMPAAARPFEAPMGMMGGASPPSPARPVACARPAASSRPAMAVARPAAGASRPAMAVARPKTPRDSGS